MEEILKANMKICVVIDDYLPDSTRVGAKMMHELSVEFVRRGHEVTVVTPQSNTNEVEIKTIEGVNVRRFPSGKIKNVSKFRRAINESLLPWRAWRSDSNFLKSTHHDFIIYYSPCIFWGPLVRRLKKIWDAPAYLVLRDFFPQWAIDIGMLSEKSILTKYFRYCEATSYAQADVIGIQSPNNLRAFQKECQVGSKLELLYNWAQDKPGQVASDGFRARLGLHNKIIFLYGGAITKQQDIPNLLRLAKRLLSQSNAHFLIVGEGYELDTVKEIVHQQNLNNVTIHPTVDQEAFRNLLAEVDIGLFSLARNHSTHNFPGKVLGYLVHGLPILGSVNPGNDLKDVINEAGAGFVAINGDDEGVAEAALRLLKDAPFRIKAGRAARDLLDDKFSVSSAAETIEKAMSHHLENVKCES